MADFNWRTATDTDLTQAFYRVYGYAGASRAAASQVTFPVSQRGIWTGVNYVANTPNVLGLADFRSGLLESTSNTQNTEFQIPTLATLGYTFDTNNPAHLFISFYRRGTGLLSVNPVPASGVVINDPNGLNPLNRPTGSITNLILRSTDVWDFC